MKLTVITAVYNREATIAQAIASVRRQTWPDVEHLVVDGASTDGTLAAIEAVRHDRMRLVSEPDDGIYDALNKGIRLATGDVIGLVHSDDFFAHDDVLAKVAEAFREPAVDAVYGDLDYVSASDPSRIVRRWRSGEFEPAKLRRGWMPPHPTLFLRRRVFETYGGYDTTYRISSDYDAVLRYFGSGTLRARYIPEVLVKMRTGGASGQSPVRFIRKNIESYAIIRKNGIGGLGVLFFKNFSKIAQFSGRE
mgnify:CR=1 FL=1